MTRNKYLIVVIMMLGILTSLTLAQQIEPAILEDANICLVFERIENRILEDKVVTVFLRNCGRETLSNITVVLTYGEEVQAKTISTINPREIKYVRFYALVDIGERKLVSVYAFNNLISIKYDFYVERPTYLHAVKLETNTDKLTKNELNEVYLIVKNSDLKSFENLGIEVEAPTGVTVSYEINKISLYPLQTRIIKLRIFVSEDYREKTATLKIKVGEKEFIRNFVIVERIEINWNRLVEMIILTILAIVALYVAIRIIERRLVRKERRLER